MLTDLFAVKMYKNTKNDKKIDIIYKFLVTFPAFYGTILVENFRLEVSA